jgi:hypothetical protein
LLLENWIDFFVNVPDALLMSKEMAVLERERESY